MELHFRRKLFKSCSKPWGNVEMFIYWRDLGPLAWRMGASCRESRGGRRIRGCPRWGSRCPWWGGGRVARRCPVTRSGERWSRRSSHRTSCRRPPCSWSRWGRARPCRRTRWRSWRPPRTCRRERVRPGASGGRCWWWDRRRYKWRPRGADWGRELVSCPVGPGGADQRSEQESREGGSHLDWRPGPALH